MEITTPIQRTASISLLEQDQGRVLQADPGSHAKQRIKEPL